MNPEDLLALIHVPQPGTTLTHEQIMATAIAVGPPSMATEPILGSNGRQDAIELLNFCSDSVGELQSLAAGLTEHKAERQYQIICELCDGIARMSRRLDSYVQRDRERQRQARAKARADIEASLPDPDNPDAPRGVYPAPSLQPDLRASDPGEYPDDDGLTYDKPTDLPRDRPANQPRPDDDDDTGNLPLELLPGAPPLVGTMPVWDPQDLEHPQPVPPTQVGTGGP
jgi:hypothetical protein